MESFSSFEEEVLPHSFPRPHHQIHINIIPPSPPLIAVNEMKRTKVSPTATHPKVTPEAIPKTKSPKIKISHPITKHIIPPLPNGEFGVWNIFVQNGVYFWVPCPEGGKQPKSIHYCSTNNNNSQPSFTRYYIRRRKTVRGEAGRTDKFSSTIGSS
jgi:hypothetical protein